MENPFELIISRLDRIEKLLQNASLTGSEEAPRKEGKTIFDVNEVCKYLHMSKSSIYKMTADRIIPHYKRGKLLYFNKIEIDDWVMENRVKTMSELEKEATEYLLKSKFKR